MIQHSSWLFAAFVSGLNKTGIFDITFGIKKQSFVIL